VPSDRNYKNYLITANPLGDALQRLLEHSSPDLTNIVYMNVDPVMRQAIDTMPAGDWLRIRIVGKRGKNVQ
jgi:hypothetical protein